MFRFVIGSILSVAVMAAPASAGLPLTPADQQLRQCVGASALADRVVVGRVVEVETDLVKARPVPGSIHLHTYRVVRIAVADTLAGGRAVTGVRIAGIHSDLPKVSGPDVIQWPDPFAKDAEGLFFMALHHSGDFYTFVHFVPKYQKENFDSDTKSARHFLGLLADPFAGLQSKEPEDRLTTAVLLLVRYQTHRGAKTVPIPAKESESILAALAEVEWGRDPDAPLHPFRVVSEVWRLHHIRASNFGAVYEMPVLPGKTSAEQSEFLREWVRKNRATHRIERTAYD